MPLIINTFESVGWIYNSKVVSHYRAIKIALSPTRGHLRSTAMSIQRNITARIGRNLRSIYSVNKLQNGTASHTMFVVAVLSLLIALIVLDAVSQSRLHKAPGSSGLVMHMYDVENPGYDWLGRWW